MERGHFTMVARNIRSAGLASKAQTCCTPTAMGVSILIQALCYTGGSRAVGQASYFLRLCRAHRTGHTRPTSLHFPHSHSREAGYERHHPQSLVCAHGLAHSCLFPCSLTPHISLDTLRHCVSFGTAAGKPCPAGKATPDAVLNTRNSHSRQAR